jgi:hypothetical protein
MFAVVQTWVNTSISGILGLDSEYGIVFVFHLGLFHEMPCLCDEVVMNDLQIQPFWIFHCSRSPQAAYV